MSIEEIRKLFPYAGISVADGKISLVYYPTHESGISVHEEICDELGNKKYFVRLLESADEVEISVSERFARLVFYCNEFNGCEGFQALPLKRPKTGKEINDIMDDIAREYEETDALKDLRWFFRGVNLNDSCQVGKTLKDWDDYESQFEESEPTEISVYIKWRNFSAYISDIKDAFNGAEFEISNPGDCGDIGWCSATLDFNLKNKVCLNEKGLNALRNIVKESELITLDTEIMDEGNSITITLFS